MARHHPRYLCPCCFKVIVPTADAICWACALVRADERDEDEPHRHRYSRGGQCTKCGRHLRDPRRFICADCSAERVVA